MIDVVTIETPSLGDRSYVVTDGTVAVAVDPQRDHDRVLDVLQARGLRLTHVLETHIHNDYVTGGYALAQATGAQYCVNGEDEVSYERTPVRDGDEWTTGALRVRALATPGHTFTHLSYAVDAPGDDDGPVVFTGGSLLHGSTGRPDLLGPDHTQALARHQHASARRLVDELPDATEIYPTHGFGSFCAATPTSGDASTIGSQRDSNPALQQDVEEWVEQTLASLTAYPAYYVHMAPANSAGPGAPDLSPAAPADPAELRRRIDAGEWVVDLRRRTEFAAGHLRGAFNFGNDGSFITYLGWLVPWGTALTLLADSPQDLEAAQRDLVRIGIERPAAAASGRVEDWAGDELLATYPRRTFADLAGLRSAGDDPHVLDVRRDDERRAGHVADSQHVPLHELLERVDEVPRGQAVWVHCAAGYRSSIAAAVLDRAGVDVVLVDDSFDNAGTAGLTIERTA
ncbi:MBL fold metallo-hydrolase [Aquipuribacter nitratireducens]|uniref:Rhodanese-like domain-containing protein n=1 Tax=Aquipuribacter nitratireducens TaxID=650104 RepID=A0ABW0GIE9_9MICO